MDLHWFDLLQKVVAPLAVVAGAVWVLMNYIRNRTHVPRLQLDIDAEVVQCGPKRFLLATVRVKNVGLSIVKLPSPSHPGAGPRGSAILLSPVHDRDLESDPIEAAWDDIYAFDVLEHHKAIEPGLTINQQKLICLPDRRSDAFLVRLRVLAYEQSWSAEAIAISNGQASSSDA